jgi:uncharacterized protein
MKKAVEKYGSPFVLFGGEPLIIPTKDLEIIFSWGYTRYGKNAIQTNGTLIEAKHIALFKKFNVSVGISIDGPDRLNDLRIIGSKDDTRKFTKKTESAIRKLCKERIPVSLIITLHRTNASPERLPILIKWIKKLDNLGIRSVRLHLLEAENDRIREAHSLSPDENIYALLSLFKLQFDLQNIEFDVFQDMFNMLLGKDGKASCVWKGCDPYTTEAVTGIDGIGQVSNCLRADNDGINYVKSDVEGFERYISLYHTPFEFGGCKGCRFFLMCKGNCPGTAIDNDWRNRTEHCEIWKSVFEYLEKVLIRNGVVPVSADASLRQGLENEFLHNWANGKNTTMEKLIKEANYKAR